MRIEHNISAVNTLRLLSSTTKNQSKIGERLSSGYKINRASDNAAGLSISEKMRAQIRGLSQASRNAQDGISMIETADGALNEVHNILQRMRELSVQASNGTSTDDDRKLIQTEVNGLVKEVTRISNDTEFNNMKLLNGSLAEDSSNLVSSSKAADALNIVYVDDYKTAQTAVGSATDNSANYIKLKNMLKTEIVPQAISRILKTYSPAFDYLSSSSVGIGLNLSSDPNSGALASVSMQGKFNTQADQYNFMYSLYINTAGLIDKNGDFLPGKREKLETTVAHEFVHAIMDEALTTGMTGCTKESGKQASNKYPLWFIEGLAQTAAGGYANCNDFVNDSANLNINKNSTTQEIAQSLAKHSLKKCNSGDVDSPYGTGYLACMYLGHLMSESDDISAQSITSGLRNMFCALVSGESLNAVIKEKTNNKYSSLADFENKFGNLNSDPDSLKFIKDLTIKVGEGNGSLITGDLTSTDVLPDEVTSAQIFNLNTDNDTISNEYNPKEVNVLDGGGVTSTGKEPVEGYTKGIGGTSKPSGGEIEKPPIVDPPIDQPIEKGTEIDLANIKAIDGIDYDTVHKTLTINKNGDYTLKGTGAVGVNVVVANGIKTKVTLDNVTIKDKSSESADDGTNFEYLDSVTVGDNSELTLNLVGDSSLTANSSGSGVAVSKTGTLNITGDGKLTATGGMASAGIGGTAGKECGTINISSGTVTAIGGKYSAGIGGSMKESGGKINITGGSVTAVGGEDAAGIGGGILGTGGTINITGGTVNSTGGIDGAGIGGGRGAEGGNIKIDGKSAVVVAKKGSEDAEDIGHGAGVSKASEKPQIGNGIISDGKNWKVNGSVTITTSIKIDGTFTGGSGTKITIEKGGSISGTGTINVNGGKIDVENGGNVASDPGSNITIKVDKNGGISVSKGGEISGGAKIDNGGTIENKGTVGATISGDPMKNFISVEDIEEAFEKFKLKIGESLQDALKRLSDGIDFTSNGSPIDNMLIDKTSILGKDNNSIMDASKVIVNKDDTFTYSVTYRLPEDVKGEFSLSNGFNNNMMTANSKIAQQNTLNYADASKKPEISIGDKGRSVTFTYKLSPSGSSSTGGGSGSGGGTADSTGKISLQIGANANQIMGISIDGVSAADLAIDNVSVGTQDDAGKAITSCTKAINKVSGIRSKLGAYQNRLEHTIANLDNGEENLQNSESRIRDLDIAKGMAEYSKYQILSQVEQSMLSQANQTANNVLNLLRA